MNIDKMYIEEFLNISAVISNKGLSWGASGNISSRISDDAFIVTCSGSHFSLMREEDITLCAISSGEYSGKRPSMEYKMHKLIYRERKDVKAVIHIHPFYSVFFLTYSEFNIDLDIIPEAKHYLGNLSCVEYAEAGTDKLAVNVMREVKKGADLILLKRHGIVAVGASFKEALARAEAIEFICRLSFAKYGCGVL